MIEPPPSAKQPIRRGNRLPGREAQWTVNGDARNNRAAQLANDLQQILSFASRELNRQTRAALSDQSIEPPAHGPIESLVKADVRRETQPPEMQTRRFRSMPVPRIGVWRDGLLRNGPWLVSATLSGLIAVEFARASMTLFGGTPPPAPLPAAAMNARALERPVIDVRSIVAAQLFGVFAADPSSQDPSGSPRTAANLLLAGTLATENPKTGLAIIISDTGPAEVYQVGASVGGASLQSVYRDRVILSRNGRLETLVLPKLSLKGKSATPPGPPSRMAESNEPDGLDAGKALTAADLLRTSASVGPDGRLRGFRVFPNGNRVASFDKSGLRGGDLLVAVNGASMLDLDRQTGKEILNGLSTPGTVTVTIERNGERRDVTLNALEDASPAE
jgi:general secretion pathway protein C